MRNLFFSGFLGSKEDLKPITNENEENIFVDLQKYISLSSNLDDLTQNIKNELGDGEFDKAIGYSFGGRVLSRLDLNIRKKFFISANLLEFSETERQFRNEIAKKWIIKFKKNILKAKEEWNELPLFSNHNMESYRLRYSLKKQNWDENQIIHYLENFFTFKPGGIFFNKSDFLIYGENDTKYESLSIRLQNEISLKSIENAGHRCCYEKPETLKKFIQGVDL